jgi:hypothetical protein
MKRLATLAGMAMLITSACGGAASPAATQPSLAPMATAPGAASPAVVSPTAAPVTAKVTFDGQACSYAGPAVVEDGAMIVWVFENTPAAIEASTKKGAKSIGSDLVVIPVAEGTTWEKVVGDTPPEGTKGDWPPAPAWLVTDSAQVGYGPSATISTVADGYGYLVMCNLYWDYKKTTLFAMHKGALVQVLKG